MNSWATCVAPKSVGSQTTKGEASRSSCQGELYGIPGRRDQSSPRFSHKRSKFRDFFERAYSNRPECSMICLPQSSYQKMPTKNVMYLEKSKQSRIILQFSAYVLKFTSRGKTAFQETIRFEKIQRSNRMLPETTIHQQNHESENYMRALEN